MASSNLMLNSSVSYPDPGFQTNQIYSWEKIKKFYLKNAMFIFLGLYEELSYRKSLQPPKRTFGT
jgi:hypothetical protein